MRLQVTGNLMIALDDYILSPKKFVIQVILVHYF